MNTPGWRKHIQLKITWNEFKPESAHLAVANTVISSSFLPSSPPASLRLSLTRAQVSSCAPGLGEWSDCSPLKPERFYYCWCWFTGESEQRDAHVLPVLPFWASAITQMPEGAGEMGPTGWLSHRSCRGHLLVTVNRPGGGGGSTTLAKAKYDHD